MKKYILLLLISFSVFSQSGLIARQNFARKPNVNLWGGLVSLYKLDESTGSTAVDSFGALNLTNSGLTINQTGILSGAYLSTAGNQNASLTGAPAITSKFSINAWCYRTASGTGGDNVIVENGDYGNGFGIWMNAAGFAGPFYNYNYGNYIGEALPLNTWTMVTCTYDGVDIKTYLNGVLKATIGPWTYTNTATTRRLFNRTSNSSAFIGKLDNVSFFNTALPPSTIVAHYNGGVGITL